MTRTIRPQSILWSSILFTAVPIVTIADATAQFRGPRPVAMRPAPPRPVRNFPAPRAPTRGLRANTPRAPIARPPQRRGSPSNTLLPSDKSGAPTGGSGGNEGRLPSPVTLTLESISADPEEKARARQEAREFFKLKIPVRVTAPAMRKVTKLRWHKTLAKASIRARAEKKPILWIQALGDLKGFT